MKIDGGCHCGYITYVAEIDPDKVGICHCTDCQTLSGSAFRTSVAAARDAFSLRTGQPKIYVKTAASGAKNDGRRVRSWILLFSTRLPRCSRCSAMKGHDSQNQSPWSDLNSYFGKRLPGEFGYRNSDLHAPLRIAR